ncbi:MAG: T9SS type A sorting domain-containing protein [Bacteroidales bacterium]|nr:T9SS type A sorting domain-containing protein [Bacteroidales bacterium]
MLEIMNLDGETLYKRKFTKEIKDIDTSPIPQGVYFVKIQRKNCVETMKLYVSKP